MPRLQPFRTVSAKLAPRASLRASSPWSWAWVGAVLGLVVSLTLNAPARWLANGLQQATQGRLVFQDPRGTMWHGSAQLVLTGGAGSTDSAALPGRFTWRLQPTLSGLLANVQSDCCIQTPLNVSLTPRWGGAKLALADSLTQWPAQWLTGLGTPWNTVQPQWQLTLSTRALTLAVPSLMPHKCLRACPLSNRWAATVSCWRGARRPLLSWQPLKAVCIFLAPANGWARVFGLRAWPVPHLSALRLCRIF